MFVRSLLKMVSKRSKKSWKKTQLQKKLIYSFKPRNRVPCVLHVHQQSAPIVPFLWVSGAEQRALFTHIYIYIWVVPSPLPVTVANDGEWFPTKNVIILVVTVTGKGNRPISMYLYTLDFCLNKPWQASPKSPKTIKNPFLIGCFTKRLFVISISTPLFIIIQLVFTSRLQSRPIVTRWSSPRKQRILEVEQCWRSQWVWWDRGVITEDFQIGQDRCCRMNDPLNGQVVFFLTWKRVIKEDGLSITWVYPNHT